MKFRLIRKKKKNIVISYIFLKNHRLLNNLYKYIEILLKKTIVKMKDDNFN